MDDGEFRSYVGEQRPALLRAATLLAAGDVHLAEDLVQTALTKLYLTWPAFRAASNPAGYARRVLVNALIDEGRRSWRRHEHSQGELSDPTPEPPAGSLRVDQVHQALSALPPRMRAVVVLRYFEGLSTAETASALGCSAGNVKSQLARALGKLRELLAATAASADPPLARPHAATAHAATAHAATTRTATASLTRSMK
jgi:RNA polymerase sigma-70 factor (sigma-E family)